MGGIKLRVLVRQLHAGDQKVVLLVTGVGAENQAVHAVVLALRSEQHCQENIRINDKLSPGHIREPLGGQTGPL